MIYQPCSYLDIRAACNEAADAFTFTRFIRLPVRVYNGWIEPYPGAILRERYAVPLVHSEEMKPGFYWPELVH